MKPLRLPILIIASLALAVGCAPDPLEGFSDLEVGAPTNNGTDAGANNATTGDGGGMTTAGGFTQEFLAIAEIMTANCGQANCHGPGANGVFSMPAGVNATPAEVQAALSVTTPTVSGNRLIVPSSPDMSEIHVRLTKPAGDILLMPAAGLPPTQIEQVRTWIANGAIYQ